LLALQFAKILGRTPARSATRISMWGSLAYQ
jgi:hypothetical protein